MPFPDFLEGAADLHVHSSPDVVPRRFDDIELAQEAVRAGMSALLIKSHENSTVERAALVSKIVPGVRVFGGLVLNDTVGGLNPAAVRLALQMGAKEIWMPTHSARNHRKMCGGAGEGIGIFDGHGRLAPVIDVILDLIAANDCILGTGHLSPQESVALIYRARERGVKRILVTHPEWAATFFPVELQRELAAGGAVNFERCFVSTTHRCGFTPMKTITDAIAEVGIETTVLSTDLGQPDTPPPADGMLLYAEQLLASGFSADQLRRMAVVNPLGLLSIGLRRTASDS
jgi:hypothetical protein